MNKLRFYIVSLGLLLSGALALNAIGNGTVSAATPGQVDGAPRCTAESVGPRGSAFTVDNNVATVKFKVTGGDNCRVQLSANSFYAPTMDGRPYDKQILFQRTTKIFKPGTYTMSVGLPAKSTEAKGCFYQVDLTYGTHNVTPVLAYGHGKLDCSKPKPEFQCVRLTVDELSRTKRRFTAEATSTGGATIEKYEFGFGDGMGITVPENTYVYDYKKVGTFTGSVVVHVKVNGEIKKVTSPACSKPVTVLDEKIRVCELATKQVITIDKSAFDTTKHSMNLNDCKVVPPTPADLQVCDLTTKSIVTIKDNEFDSAKHSKDQIGRAHV